MKNCQSYPCADCEDVIAVGDREGLCDYCDHLDRKFIVNLFEIFPLCPKKKDEEMFRRKRLQEKEKKMIEGLCKIAGCERLAVKSIALFAYRDAHGKSQYNISFVCDNCFNAITDHFEKGEEKR